LGPPDGDDGVGAGHVGGCEHPRGVGEVQVPPDHPILQREVVLDEWAAGEEDRGTCWAAVRWVDVVEPNTYTSAKARMY
jgi:hypothetical protein